MVVSPIWDSMSVLYLSENQNVYEVILVDVTASYIIMSTCKCQELTCKCQVVSG